MSQQNQEDGQAEAHDYGKQLMGRQESEMTTETVPTSSLHVWIQQQVTGQD